MFRFDNWLDPFRSDGLLEPFRSDGLGMFRSNGSFPLAPAEVLICPFQYDGSSLLAPAEVLICPFQFDGSFPLAAAVLNFFFPADRLFCHPWKMAYFPSHLVPAGAPALLQSDDRLQFLRAGIFLCPAPGCPRGDDYRYLRRGMSFFPMPFDEPKDAERQQDPYRHQPRPSPNKEGCPFRHLFIQFFPHIRPGILYRWQGNRALVRGKK